ncbi:MAG TPA: hypothetical protein VFH31_03840 [Pyrinomonadaceae bacterium]|nr:hypothetical protein [Pyrinomonadaceae bacterium]
MIEVRNPTPRGSGTGKVYLKNDKLRSLDFSDLELDVRKVFGY